MKVSANRQNAAKAVIYARYSSHGQTEQSIEGQLHDNYEWAERQGVTVVGEYIDRALTGTKDQRPDFQRMIEDAAKRQFEMIIVWKLDRFARNRYDSAIYKARLKKYGVRVVSVKENITDSPEGIILEGLLESMAEYYSANLSQNVRRGMRETAAKNRFCGGHVPYGYKVQDGRLIPDEKTAPVIRYVFEQYASGTAKKQIIDELNRRGIRNEHGNPLTLTSFQRAMRMTTYIGEHVYNGQVLVGCADPLISRDTFLKVQARLNENARAPAAAKAKVPYLLSGKAVCGLCGAPMLGESGVSRTGAVHNYYACYTRKRRHACAKRNEKREALETFIVLCTMRHVLSQEAIPRVAAAVAAQYKKEFSSSRVTEYEKALAQVSRELDKLVDALITAPKSAYDTIYTRMEKLEAQKADLEADITRLRIASGITLSKPEIISWLRSLRTGDPSDPAFRARLIDTFVNSVYVYDDRVVCFYNIRGAGKVSYESLTEFFNNSPGDPSGDPSDSSSGGPSANPSGDSPSDPSGNLPDDPSATTKNSKPESSDLELLGRPCNNKSERYIFVDGVFGCIFKK